MKQRSFEGAGGGGRIPEEDGAMRPTGTRNFDLVEKRQDHDKCTMLSSGRPWLVRGCTTDRFRLCKIAPRPGIYIYIYISRRAVVPIHIQKTCGVSDH